MVVVHRSRVTTFPRRCMSTSIFVARMIHLMRKIQLNLDRAEHSTCSRMVYPGIEAAHIEELHTKECLDSLA